MRPLRRGSCRHNLLFKNNRRLFEREVGVFCGTQISTAHHSTEVTPHKKLGNPRLSNTRPTSSLHSVGREFFKISNSTQPIVGMGREKGWGGCVCGGEGGSIVGTLILLHHWATTELLTTLSFLPEVFAIVRSLHTALRETCFALRGS